MSRKRAAGAGRPDKKHDRADLELDLGLEDSPADLAGAPDPGPGLGSAAGGGGRDPAGLAGDLGPGPRPGPEPAVAAVSGRRDPAGLAGDRGRRPGPGPAGAGDDQDPEAAAMAVCLRLLTAAPRTRAQLEQALRRRAVPPRAAEAVLDRLARGRLIDDTLFAQMWVESRHHSRGLARRALSAELRQRGVGEDDVRGAVAELGPEQEEEAARRLVAGKLAATRGRPAAARMRRLMGVLARRGYPAGMAYRVVREALEQERATGGGLDGEMLPEDDPLFDSEPDDEPPGAGFSGSGLPGFGPPETGLSETGLPDAGLPDSGLPDSGLSDSGL